MTPTINDIDQLTEELARTAFECSEIELVFRRIEKERAQNLQDYLEALEQVRKVIRFEHEKELAVFDDKLEDDFVLYLGQRPLALGNLRQLNDKFKRHVGQKFCFFGFKETGAYHGFDVLGFAIAGTIGTDGITIVRDQEAMFLTGTEIIEKCGSIMLPSTVFNATFLWRPVAGKTLDLSSDPRWTEGCDGPDYVHHFQRALWNHIGLEEGGYKTAIFFGTREGILEQIPSSFMRFTLEFEEKVINLKLKKVESLIQAC